jgi:hypothetical protein
MKRLASVILATTLAVLGSLALATPAHASTQTVGFRIQDWRCPRGLYAITGVDVNGTDIPTLAMAAQWRGAANPKASVPITGVPANGGRAAVSVTFTCRTSGWWPSQPATTEIAYRWIYGSGTQPTYTI